MDDGKMEHAFSVEIRSKEYVRHMSLSNVSHDRVLFEGYLGELIGLCMIEGAVLEIRGANGVLRIDISEDDLKRMLSPKKD